MKFFLPLALVAFAVCALQAQAAPAAVDHVSPAVSAVGRAHEARADVLSAPAPSRVSVLSILGFATLALGTVALGGTRTLTQAQLTSTKALPAANANNASDGIDTNTVTPGRIPDIELGVTIPALPSLADAKTATFKVQDSADGVTYADVADLPAIALVGAGGIGNAGTTRMFKVPITMRQWVRLYQAVENAGGDNTATSGTIGFYF